MELTNQTVQKLIDRYGVGQLISFERIKQGFMNYSYVVRANKGTYVLRISKKTKTKKDRLFEISMINHLEGFPVPKFLKDKKGKYLNKYENLLYAMYEFLPGNMPKTTTKKLFKQVAHFLGQFHNKISSFHSLVDRFSWYSFSDKRANEFEKYMLKNLKYLSSEIAYLKTEMINCKLPSYLPSGAIHCDIKRDNILERNGNLSGVIDFDNCQKGPFVLDLSISIIWFCTDWNGFNYKKARKFVKYYEKYRLLTKDEKRNLFKAIKYAYLSHEFVDYFVFAKGFITEHYFQFGRNFFVPAVRKLDERKFKRVMNAKFVI